MNFLLSLKSVARSVLAVALSINGVIAVAGDLGSAYPLTSYMPGRQGLLNCHKAPNGDRLLLWNAGDDGRTVMLKRLDGLGHQIGPLENMLLGPGVLSIASNKVGGFVVLRKVTNGNNDLSVTVYNRAGNVVVPEVRVNSVTAGGVHGIVAMAPDGSFTVVWNTLPNAGSVQLHMRRFSAAGVPYSALTHLDAGPSLALEDFAMDAAGNGVILYLEMNASRRLELWQRRYILATNRYEPAARVAVDLSRLNFGGRVAMNESGNYVIAWNAALSSDIGSHLYAQFFYRDGRRGAVPVRLTSVMSHTGVGGRPALFANNSYAVAWMQGGIGASVVKLRQLDGPAGNLVGAESSVSTQMAVPGVSSVCADPSGSYSVAWHDIRNAGTALRTSDVYVRDYAADTMPPIVPLDNYQGAQNLSGQAGTWKYFKVTVPANTGNLRVALTSRTFPASGNADLYVRYAGLPTAGVYDGRTSAIGNTETLLFGSLPPGAFYIGVYAQAGYAATDLNVRYY